MGQFGNDKGDQPLEGFAQRMFQVMSGILDLVNGPLDLFTPAMMSEAKLK